MSDYRDCADCYYGQRINKGARICDATPIPIPVSYMRQPDRDCGVEAALFEPKDSNCGRYDNDRD